MTERVGFVGLGIMGTPMAANLLAAGLDVIVFNRSPEPRQALVAAGAREARSVSEAVRDAEVVITMLSDDRAVQAVVAGDRGVLSAAAPGTLVIDMSTVSPAVSRELAELGDQRNVRVLDAPVSGGEPAARAGTLSIMVGGEAADVERARAVFDVLGGKVVHVGPAGCGQVVKACNQIVVALNIAAVSEALVLGSKLGVGPELVLDVLSTGSAASRIMESKRTNFVERDFAPGFKVDLHHKDLDIALRSAGEANVGLPLTAQVQQFLRELRARGRGDDDHSALLAVVEQHAAHCIASVA